MERDVITPRPAKRLRVSSVASTTTSTDTISSDYPASNVVARMYSGPTTYLASATGAAGAIRRRGGNAVDDMSEKLSRAVVIGRGPECTRFLPRDEVKRIMQYDAVLATLKECLLSSDVPLAEHYASVICGSPSQERPAPSSSLALSCSNRQYRRNLVSTPISTKLFALLILCDMPDSILDFICEGITDNDLPFQVDMRRLSFYRHDRQATLVKSFQKWPLAERMRFVDLQPVVMAPVLPDIFGDCLLLTEADQIPVIESDATHRTTDVAHIWRVKFHPAHHNFSRRRGGLSGVEPDYGIQRIFNTEFARYESEVGFLRRYLHVPSSHHIVRLLSWFKHWGQLYLVYFWSPGDLGRYLRLTHPRKTHSFTLWFARQWEGIVGALCRVHLLPLLPNGHHSIHWNLIQGRATLTPENIVWVPRENLDDCEDPDGIFQLGVLGCCFASLYVDKLSSQSIRDGGRLPIAATSSLTYMAPERVFPSTGHEKDTRQRCDVWSLGCIFLEAVTWFLLGQRAVKVDFPEARTWLPTDRKGVWDVTDDGFFCVEIDEKTDAARAIVNPGVSAWIRRLRIHAACSPYLADFLSLIERRMLVVEEDGRERISAEELLDELRRLREKAETPEYAVSTLV